MRLITTTALAALFAIPAYAQQNCAPYEHVKSRLAEKYGETRQSIGTARTQTVEVYANLETGTWTVVVTSINGTACFVSAGQNFQRLNEALPEGDPT